MPRAPSRKTPYVVYVRFPSGGKEYVYLCSLPNITVGSRVIANGTEVTVHRVAAFDSLATKYVTSAERHETRQRVTAIAARLDELARREARLAVWSKLKSLEAKRLVRELKELTK